MIFSVDLTDGFRLRAAQTESPYLFQRFFHLLCAHMVVFLLSMGFFLVTVFLTEKIRESMKVIIYSVTLVFLVCEIGEIIFFSPVFDSELILHNARLY